MGGDDIGGGELMRVGDSLKSAGPFIIVDPKSPLDREKRQETLLSLSVIALRGPRHDRGGFSYATPGMALRPGTTGTSHRGLCCVLESSQTSIWSEPLELFAR